MTILADSGVRSGIDVIKMLALGANAVLLGRLFVFALATAGQSGVERLLETIEKEMRVAMTLMGVSDVTQIDRSALLSL